MNSYEIPGKLIVNSREILMNSYEIPMKNQPKIALESPHNRAQISSTSSPNRPQIESKSASWRGPEGIAIWEASGAALGESRGGP